MDWPIPFGGIKFSLKCSSIRDLQVLTQRFITCNGHAHNFAVQVDGLTLYFSEQALKCMQRIVNETPSDAKVRIYVGGRNYVRTSEAVPEVPNAG
jgi:hypothetical protein